MKVVLLFVFRYRIKSTGSPGMATGNAFGAQPDSFDDSPFLDGFNCILGAGGSMTAMCTKMRREHQLVEANGQDENLLEHDEQNVILKI